MVRKRGRSTRTRRNSRKTYESDDNDSSEAELDLDSPPASPAPKRYGLRQRKQPVFFADYDYEDEENVNAEKQCSDDDEYNVEVDIHEAKVDLETRKIKSSTRSRSSGGTQNSSVTVSTIEPESEDASMEDGLIDFEDVIRADVVVNKQRLDYDSVIDKTEIQVELIDTVPPPPKPKGRRGRKPKNHQEPVNHINNLEGNSNCVNNGQEEDTNLEVHVDPLTLVQAEGDSDESDTIKKNGFPSEEDKIKSSPDKKDTPVANGAASKSIYGPSRVDDIEKFVPPELDEKEKEVVLSNEYLLGNCFDLGADEFLEKQSKKTEEVEEEEHIPVINFDDDDLVDDDDVIIIEKKPEIIVLDDD